MQLKSFNGIIYLGALISCLLLPSVSLSQNQSGDSLLNFAYNKLGKITNAKVEFKYNSKTKFDFDIKAKDTLTKYGTLSYYSKAKSENYDSLLYSLKLSDGVSYIYFNDTCHKVDSKDSTIKSIYSKNNPFWIFGVHGLRFIKTISFQNDRIQKIIGIADDEEFKIKLCNDTVINTIECFCAALYRDDSIAGTNPLFTPSYIKKLFISKKDSFLIAESHFKVEHGFDFFWNESVTKYNTENTSYESIINRLNKELNDFREIGFSSKERRQSEEVKNNSGLPELNTEPVVEGKILPNWKLPTYENTEDSVELYTIESKYILLDFWYASCAPCLQDIPKLKKIASSYSTSDLTLLAINVFDKDTSRISAIDKRYQFTYPILINGRDLALNVYGQKSYPYKILLDSDYKVLGIYEGYSVKKGPSKLEVKLKELLGN